MAKWNKTYLGQPTTIRLHTIQSSISRQPNHNNNNNNATDQCISPVQRLNTRLCVCGRIRREWYDTYPSHPYIELYQLTQKIKIVIEWVCVCVLMMHTIQSYRESDRWRWWNRTVNDARSNRIDEWNEFWPFRTSSHVPTTMFEYLVFLFSRIFFVIVGHQLQLQHMAYMVYTK